MENSNLEEYVLLSRRGQLIKIDIGKPFDKSITIDINHVNVIDCIDQSIKIDTHNSSGNYCHRCYRFYRWMSIVYVFLKFLTLILYLKDV